MSWMLSLLKLLMMPIEAKIAILLIFTLIIIIFYAFLKVMSKGGIYQFELVFMGPGVNQHEFIRGDSLDFEHERESKKVKITSDRLYRVKPGIFKRLLFKIKGINQKFIVIYQKGKKIPVAPVEIKISSRVLGEVKESRALDKALKSEFAIPMDLKKILMIMGFLVIVVIAWLVVTGQVVI
ncbi:hypothetical protein ES702_01941 [subsurface metagenome]